jgi:serine protease AprX
MRFILTNATIKVLYVRTRHRGPEAKEPAAVNFKRCLLIIALITIFSLNSFGANIVPPRKYVLEKRSPAVTERAYQYLSQKSANGSIKVWVYFTDKGVYNESQMLKQARVVSESMTERTKARRAKNNASAIRFQDLPVKQEYVNIIKGKGPKLRQVSKWLNAASFETTIDSLELIEDLPFIQKIEPLAGYRKTPEPQEPSVIRKPGAAANKDAAHLLSYGSSFGQLDQINVVAAHDSGFSGTGVIIAMFDSGFRKTHEAFTNIMSGGRLLAEYDFINDDYETSNETGDDYSQWNHGTITWSVAGGSIDGELYGPAYGASFVLCKTEDITSETQVEEDNWAAAVEWVDSIGVDVISSSLYYLDWYTASDYDGNTCVTTIAADYAASVGIVVCNCAGNGGPAASTLGAPADADSIVTVGAVYSSGTIIGFSSRGPTYDGRIKPEVCAQGSSVYCASAASDSYISTANGTSLSTPLVAGAAALLIEAHPDWTAMEVREALMQTASRALTPDNNYGWGIVNTMSAIRYIYIPPYLQGDANFDGNFNISDAVYLINYIFIGGDSPEPVLEAGDANDDGEVNTSDAVFLINFVFLPGAPAPPGYNP